MTGSSTTCAGCGAEILLRTAAKNGGKCLPCAQGTRAQIERRKAEIAEERARTQANEAALSRIQQRENPKFADFLAEQDPADVLWRFLVSAVFHDPSNENLGALSAPAKALYLVGVLDGEVFNGGFHQYFSNSSGQYAHEALESLLQVGAAEAARLLREAIHAFPGNRVPKDRAERNDALDRVAPQHLEALDTKYYALADTRAEDLASLTLAFMQRNAMQTVAA